MIQAELVKSGGGKLRDLVFWSVEVQRLPPPRCSSADPVFLAVKFHGECEWRLCYWWPFFDDKVHVGETHASLDSIMLHLAKIYSRPMELEEPYRSIWANKPRA